MKPMAKLFVRLTLIGSAALPASVQAIFSAASGSSTLVGTIQVLAYRGTFDLEEMLFIQGQVAP
jgi:hypothetical protein